MQQSGGAPVTKIKPLIKWTGGKYDEYSEFAELIPSFNKYYEPFFGGGGVFFALQPGGMSFLNDKSVDLITFYKLIQNETFAVQLNEYANAWEQATRLSEKIAATLLPVFMEFAGDGVDKHTLNDCIKACLKNIEEGNFNPLFDAPFIVEPAQFRSKLIHSLTDKFNRIKNIQKKESREFSKDEMRQHAETGVKSGLYLFLRSISNKAANGELQLSQEKATANWYFVREFCYASMFRYNRQGGFNIPYGGIAYNKKNFRAKVNAITSDATKQLFANSVFSNLDFADFMEQTKPAKDDFVFLDPPYDSEFSEYDRNSFSQKDQVRLRDAIMKCKARCMIVIKETEFIRELYSSPHFNIIDFDKTYTYNVRGRNNRETKHLIILNYEAPVIMQNVKCKMPASSSDRQNELPFS